LAEIGKKLAERLKKEKGKTLEFFKGLPGAIWQRKLYADGAEWTIYEVLVHIVEAESSLTTLFVHVAEDGNGVGEDFDIDAHNKKAVEKLKGSSVEDLLEQFSQLRDRLVLAVSNWGDNQFQNVGRHPFLGEARLDEMIRLSYLHVNLHIRDVRKALKEAGQGG